ncbi:MAG TPA: bifunctional phosphopantothenoylcysteine decarboxylase/phosphopantothenate--cysteine ligase CoaBC [Bacteroidia bacterium]|jgi:phosphopantothenoylcysteine decarboxylase/phosphopantothenate--cysteine ligase|nr:bifunctional phosphopantothenoylcysteine decarboxylase/phosphopantothenate--cysteine ligase CoaBC [Bacteroidia bacterium]
MLQGKKILLGVTGGIAAYKSANLVRLLVKQGAEVKVIMTPDARHFVTTETLSVLSKNKVETEFFADDKMWNNHVHLALWADVFVIAPCTANTLAKMAYGLCDNLLMAVYLSARCKVFVAPAMDVDMLKHASTQSNLKKIVSYKNILIPSEKGELASGLEGEGRMAEPETIVAILEKQFKGAQKLAGQKVLVTAGPTYEEIDPVRFIGNRSSGKMGIAIANEFAKQGAEVTLVLGPSKLSPEKNVNCIRVESANEMFEHCTELFKHCTIAILAAAVADYKAADYSHKKIKKTKDSLKIKLIPTPDILATLGKQKKKQCLIGFALESENVIDYAKQKIKNKNLDFIVTNSLEDEGAGFAGDTNKVTIIDKKGKIFNYPLKTKEAVAKDILNFTLNYLKK